MNTYPTYETPRLLLKPTDESDASFILELMNTPKWHQYIGDRNVKTLEQATSYIQERMKPQFERLGYANYTLVRKEDQAKLGTCGLYDREGLEGIDIGFALLPEYERMGYALEAAQKLKILAFQEFEISAIRAITLPVNLPSQRLLEKLGLQHIDTITIPPSTEELLLYELKKEDF